MSKLEVTHTNVVAEPKRKNSKEAKGNFVMNKYFQDLGYIFEEDGLGFTGRYLSDTSPNINFFDNTRSIEFNDEFFIPNKLIEAIYWELVDLGRLGDEFKYRWHDLRKAPKDLPKEDKLCLVCMDDHTYKVSFYDYPFWNVPGVVDGFVNILPESDKIIAWKYIKELGESNI